jgi:hypothetical protein
MPSTQRKRGALVGIKEAPRATESAIRTLVKRGADFLLGRAQEDEGDTAKRRALDDRLAEQRYRAESAEAALVEVDCEIDRAKLRCKRLAEREEEFLDAAVYELGCKHVGSAYRERAEALRDVVNLAAGLSEFRGYSGGRPRSLGASVRNVSIGGYVAPKVEFVLPDFGALGSPKPIATKDADRATWRKVADALRSDPHADVSALLPKLN